MPKKRQIVTESQETQTKKNISFCFEREKSLRLFLLTKLSLNACVRFYFLLECKIFGEHFMQFK